MCSWSIDDSYTYRIIVQKVLNSFLVTIVLKDNFHIQKNEHEYIKDFPSSWLESESDIFYNRLTGEV